MERKIKTYGGYFERFMASLDLKVQRKIEYGLDLLRIQDRVSKKFVKAIRDGLFELRTEWEGNIYRVFLYSTEIRLWFFSTDFRKRVRKLRSRRLKRL